MQARSCADLAGQIENGPNLFGVDVSGKQQGIARVGEGQSFGLGQGEPADRAVLLGLAVAGRALPCRDEKQVRSSCPSW
jgi:hypothetical protein